MKKPSTYFIFALLFALSYFPLLHAQTPTPTPADANAPVPSGQVPDETTKKIADLVHAGKYAEAQELSAGLLAAYPNDQRLIKAKALIEKLVAPAGSAHTTPSSDQPANKVAPAQPATNANAVQLTGMDKVDYNALILLARQAQQTTDLDEQKKLLRQFMDQSSAFLQKHPDQMLLWQFRVVSAIGLNEPMEGYEAGQRLLAVGAADSNDPALQQLLAQLKNKGWLDWAEKIKKPAEKYGWMLGTWSESYTSTSTYLNNQKWVTKSTQYNLRAEIAFSKSAPVIEVYHITGSAKSAEPHYRGTLLDSGEMRWEENDWGRKTWEQVVSCELDEHKRTMTIVITTWLNQRNEDESAPETHLFTNID